MTEYDKENIGEILAGHGTWFTAKLLRLISSADKPTKHQMHLAFPKEVEAVHKFQTGKEWKDE